MILGGDFRQTLPVIARGIKADQLRACIKSSTLWKKAHRMQLVENMRCKLRGGDSAFAQSLLEIGDGKITEALDMKTLTQVVDSREDLVSAVFPNLHVNYSSVDWIRQRALLATTNNRVFTLNTLLLERTPGDERCFKSIDTTVAEEDAVHYSSDFLNTLDPSGAPTHNLKLKVGVPVMILRNLDPPRLCNGTRCIVKAMQANIIEAEPITGPATGETIFLPRIPIIPTDLPFSFKRLQFPIRLCYAMTINKSQGQTFQEVGLDLEDDPFTHGQLYVAVSRVGKKEAVYSYLGDTGMTKNVVYEEALC